MPLCSGDVRTLIVLLFNRSSAVFFFDTRKIKLPAVNFSFMYHIFFRELEGKLLMLITCVIMHRRESISKVSIKSEKA